MKNIILALITMLMLTACAPAQTVTPTLYPTYTLYPTHTSFPTHTPYPTYTIEPTYTPVVITKVVTPTNTPAPTLTPTPIYTATSTATTVPLSSYTTSESQIASFFNEPDNSIGQTIKILLEPLFEVYVDGTKETLAYVAVFPKVQHLFAMLAVEDKSSDETVDLQKNQYSWAYGVIIGTAKYSVFKADKYTPNPRYAEVPIVRIVHQEPIDPMKWPKEDGLYKVNQDIAPGPWYSSYSMTDDGCYWARINSSGNIINNHFGVAGITVYVSQTDAVVQFDGCGTMYYIGD